MSSFKGANSDLFDGGPPLKLQRWLGLVKPGAPRTAQRAALVVLIGWVPLAGLSIVQGDFLRHQAAQSFLCDFAVHARFLFAAPLFVLAESICLPRLGLIAQHFLNANLVAESDRARFDAAVTSTRRLRDSTWAETVVIALAYAMIVALINFLPIQDFPAWHLTRDEGIASYSVTGWWHVLVSSPLLLVLLLGWMWRLCVWTRFLRLMSRLELRLVPVHPDLAAGLKFVGYSVRVYAVLGLALGLIVAGKVANEIQYQTESLLPWPYVVAGFVVFIVALFTAPLLVFVGKLLRAWRRGVADYGALAGMLGRQFERKWFGPVVSVDEETLAVPDFSTMTDLYQFVANAYQMRVIPVDLRSLVFLVIVTLLPFLPVMLMVVPVDSLFRTLAGFLL